MMLSNILICPYLYIAKNASLIKVMSILLYDDTSLITSPEIRKKQEADLLVITVLSSAQNTLSSMMTLNLYGLCCGFVLLPHRDRYTRKEALVSH